MNQDDGRVTRVQRRRSEPEEEQLQPNAAPRRRRSQAARLQQDSETYQDTYVPSSKGQDDPRGRYARPEQKAKPAPSAPRKNVIYDDEADEGGYHAVEPNQRFVRQNAYEDESGEPAEKRHVLRWVIIILVILGLLAGATYFGLKNPGAIEPVVQWVNLLINGPTPSPSPAPTPVPTPAPTEVPPPQASEAVVIGVIADPLEQANPEQPVSFQVTATEQTSRVRIVDNNGQILIEGGEAEATLANHTRVWNLMVYFNGPYDGPVEVYPGNEAGWNEAKSPLILVRVGSAEALQASSNLTDAEGTEFVAENPAEAAPVTVSPRITVNKQTVETFARENGIYLGDEAGYVTVMGKDGPVTMNGVLAYRGSNMRKNAAFGTVAPAESRFESVWTAEAGVEGNFDTDWPAQPLIVQWHGNIRETMPIIPEKNTKTGLKEVIFPAIDGKFYCFDLEDGMPTRDPIESSPVVPMFAAPAVYPKGYPLMIVASGDPNGENAPTDVGIEVYDLIQQASVGILRNQRDEAVSPELSTLTSPLIDNATDTMIAVGGSGVLYTFKLNTSLDTPTKTLTLKPSLPETYSAKVADEDAAVVSSPAAYGDSVYYASRGGILQSVNLNTLTPNWALNLGAEVVAAVTIEKGPESAPAEGEPEGDEESAANAAIQAASLFAATAADASGNAHMLRIRPDSGEVVWNVPMPGNIYSAPLVGDQSIASLVLFAVNNPDFGSALVALNKETGEVAWKADLNTATASAAIALYTAEGKALIVQGDGTGLHLFDGETGVLLDSFPLSSAAIGSPAAFNDYIVAPTQDGKLYCVRVK